ncbi:MAG: LLM class flavin-dependent oxidoreductase [Blastomonas sp.]
MPRLSILDQSVRFASRDAASIFQGTLEAARLCDRLGYGRFWVSEHHASSFICGSSPEVLISAIGAATTRIRIGSGGIMLPHYSAYKVAENFAVLSNLYPGRVDLGVGRAPGADMRVAAVLAAPHPPDFRRFPQQVVQLRGHLTGEIREPRLSPEPAGEVPLWILGTSPDSAILAGQLGLPYAIALFINPMAERGLADIYRHHFTPSPQCSAPHLMIAVTALAADAPDQARRLQKNYHVNIARMLLGNRDGQALSPDETMDYEFDAREAMLVGSQAQVSAFGVAAEVRDRLEQIARTFGADEIMVSTNCYDRADRMRSLELMAECFELAEAA